MNRTLLVAGALALFFLGVLAGLFLRQSSPEPGPRPSTELQRPQPALRSRPPQDVPSADAEVLKLQARVRELEAEVQKARRIPPKPDPDASPAAFAEELFKAYLELNKGKNADPEKARTLFSRLGQLDEKSAGYFIEQFRKSRGPDLEDERETAMELALACGGTAVSDFVNLLLNDATLESELRSNLLDELSGAGGGLFSIRRLPISDALGSTAMTLCQSSISGDREGGAGLLGGLKTETARRELQRLIGEDSDLGVKTAATLSLGHVGGHDSRIYLERLWTAPETARLTGQPAAKFRNAIESALKELAER